jgi:hypothetical protein
VIEDRGAALIRPDGSVIAGVLDGVGEVYSDQTKRTLHTAPDEQQRCLGDVPGLILWNTLKEGPLNSEADIQNALRSATEVYCQWLGQNGLGDRLEGKKHEIGGCTFAFTVRTPSGELYLVSGGDAIACAVQDGAVVAATKNQLPDVNACLEPTKKLLEATLKEALQAANPDSSPEDLKKAAATAARKIFNEMWKKVQRNELTNSPSGQVSVNKEAILGSFDSKAIEVDLFGSAPNPLTTDSVRNDIRQLLSDLIPPVVSSYAFFDGNVNVAEAAQIIKLKGVDHNKPLNLIMVTDGCFDSAQPQPGSEVAMTFGKSGVSGLLTRQSATDGTGNGPEATAVILVLEQIWGMRMSTLANLNIGEPSGATRERGPAAKSEPPTAPVVAGLAGVGLQDAAPPQGWTRPVPGTQQLDSEG